MQGNTRWLLLFAAWLWCAVGLSQSPDGTIMPDRAASPSAGPVQRASLDIILGDRDDLTDARLEELDRFRDLEMGRELPAPPPAYSVQSVLGSAVAKQGFAELSIVFDIAVSSPNGARVPLGLPGVVLRRAALYQGPGRLIRLDFDENNGGYVAYLRGAEAEGRHQLTLDVLVAIDSLGDDFRMRLSTPSAIRSELKLTVPLADAQAEISDRPEQSVVATPVPDDESSTLLTIQGLEWGQEIVWHKADNREARTPPVLSVVGYVVAKIERDQVVTEATLTVDANGESFDRFRVRLPRLAKLLPRESGEYEIAVVPSEDGPIAETDNSLAADDGLVVEVQFPEKSQLAIVTLTVQQDRQSSPEEEFFELGRFEVLGALGGQQGRIAVGADDFSQVDWGAYDGVRQVDEDPPEGLRNPAGVFRYWRQPCSLQASAVERRTWTSVEPVYDLSVRRGRVELTASLPYTIRGSGVSRLKVDLPGWICDQIDESDAPIDMSRLAPGSSGMISIPLMRPARDEASITIHAHRDIDEAGLLSFSLPRPTADSVGAALVRIQPDDDVGLVPRFAEIEDLYRSSETFSSNGSGTGQRDLLSFYVDGPEPLFVADVSFHEQSISVDVVSVANLLDGEAQVEQTLTYEIDYVPAEELILAIPQDLIEKLSALGDQLSVFLQGSRERLQLADVTSQSGLPPSKPPTVLKRVILPDEPRFSCELTIAYPIDPIPLQPQASVEYSIPLVMPVDGRLRSHDFSVQTSAEVEIRLNESIGQDCWSSSKTAAETFLRRNELQLTSNQPVSVAPLLAHLIDRDLLGSTSIEQAWIQTWLTKDERQDRAVFRFTSDQEHLVLSIPKGIDLGNVKVYLDGTVREAEVYMDGAVRESQRVEQNRLSVKLTPDPDNRPHLLEIVYHGTRRADRGWMSLELPRVGEDVWVRRTFWRLILPRDEHVVVEPENCTSEFHWGWNGWFWGRVPTMGQSDLESLVTAQRRTSLPDQTSRYLFSSLGPIERVQLRTADRTSILLLGSSIVLIVGLGLIYFRAVRRPAILFVVVVVLCTAAAFDPTSTLLLAQAASLGLALTLLASLLHRSLCRRGCRSARQEAFSSILDRGSTETQLHSPLPANSESTDTASAVVPPSPRESS